MALICDLVRKVNKFPIRMKSEPYHDKKERKWKGERINARKE